MAQLTLKQLAEKMRGIDFAVMTTRTEAGALAGRPMSNNGDVEYDGDSWFFAFDHSRVVKDLRRYPVTSLSLRGKNSLFGAPGIFITVEGKGELSQDRALMEKHWAKDAERYFQQGIDTPGLVLIKVRATRIHWWHDEDEGEIAV